MMDFGAVGPLSPLLSEISIVTFVVMTVLIQSAAGR